MVFKNPHMLTLYEYDVRFVAFTARKPHCFHILKCRSSCSYL